MNSVKSSKAARLIVFLVLLSGLSAAAFGQTKPLLQPIIVQKTVSSATPAPTPLVAKTGSSQPVNSSAAAASVSSSLSTRRTSIPALADVEIPGYSGVLVQDLNGNLVLDSNSNFAFNPASNVKVATAYAIIKTFGPDYRFATSVWTDGQIDAASGTLYGNVYVSGRDPVFNYEHAVTVASELNRMGIRTVGGDLTRPRPRPKRFEIR
jgi:D-alanyl-D-alanine carboxypeptidase/D-alanyl-D-alanine-endopeptidase (penicillin-binding protein 4)